MSINIGPPQVDELKPRIAVIGVGGAGGNAIANMISAKVEGVDFIVANTDAQALNASPAERRIQLGTQITQGLGAGSRPEVGRAAAEESIAQVEEALEGAHMCFVAAGMGGGTGTGAAPVIAKAARDRGILTVGVVTKPFTFEGARRMRSAESGISELQDHVDTLIVIPNQNLFLVANPNTTFKEAFTMADEVLQQGVRGITDLMVMPGLINLDFADVRSVMREMGKAMMGTGEAEGDGRALEAAQKAIANPLLDGVSMAGAKGVIVSIVGGEDMRLMEVDEAANHIRELVDPDANIIWGSAFNESLEGKIRVSVVATGIEGGAEADAAGAAAAPAPTGRSFAFQPKRTAAPIAPAAPAPVVEDLVDPGVEDVPVKEEAPAADPAPGFSLGGGAKDAATPAPAPAPTPAPAASEEPMELSQVAATYDDTADELVLGDPAKSAPGDYRPAPAPGGAPGAAPAPSGAAPSRAAGGGGTLFERMSRLSRGGAPSEAEAPAKSDSVDIPRFLNKQNNQ
ncbi:cell division protein FtsZ [Sphingopyxis sp. MWB1]|uniref:cell division protein FtsZ n=1 Tax=Sphingopyxis sp. MWB1 TaxID=1537715 RepID=UPI00051A3074|nr:cell division protein FtsZ [Sphingopyxis sp. MWB1]